VTGDLRDVSLTLADPEDRAAVDTLYRLAMNKTIHVGIRVACVRAIVQIEKAAKDPEP
jgi:hypothetical protein